MTSLDQINARLDRIEEMLRQALAEKAVILSRLPASEIQSEIAMVKASGGNLVEHFKSKARATMAAEKKQRGKRS